MNLLKGVFLKLGLIYGALLLIVYLFFRVQFINLTPALAVLAILLFIAELHTVFHLFGLLYCLWPRKYQQFKLNKDRNLKINIFICVCGEPKEIVRQTILAAQQSVNSYIQKINPKNKPKIYVLNDGLAAKKENATEIKLLCQELKVNHIARKLNNGFKAGNINNGLKLTPTADPENTVDIVFDADFAAKEEFLLEITKPFIDKKIDFVQSPQRYQNQQTWVAKASGAHQIFFFDWICPSKGADNGLFLCGTNFAIRRAALNSVGGMDARFITEDYATSLNLHLLGKKGVFMSKVLALGIAPYNLKEYFSQQRRWSKGSFDVTRVYFKQILFGPLTLRQKFHYLLSATYYLIGLRDLFLILAPLPYLFFGTSLLTVNSWTFILLVYGPLLLYNFILYQILFSEPLKSLVLDIVSFPVFTGAFLSSIFKKKLGFVVTIKKYSQENPFSVYKIQLIVAILLFLGLIYNRLFVVRSGFGTFINSFWATFDATFLSLGFLLIIKENYGLETLTSAAIKMGSFKNYLFRPSFAIVFVSATLVFSYTNPGIKDKAYAGVETISNISKTEELLVPSYGVYYGYFLPNLNQHPQNPEIKLIPEESPSLVMFYQDFGQDSNFDSLFVEKLSQKGVVPVITWEPNRVGQPEYSPQVITSGRYDGYIHKWAKGAEQYKKPIFLRFAHEMNGNWYPWGAIKGNTPKDYILMWRHVHDIFKEEKADNVIWVWSPNNTDAHGSSNNILDYYPGDQYVDWVGFSGFNWGATNKTKWKSFKQIAEDVYWRLDKLNKPIMVSETSSASAGGDKKGWFERTLFADIPSMPKIKAVVFYNAKFGQADFELSKVINQDTEIGQDLISSNYYLKKPKLVFN